MCTFGALAGPEIKDRNIGGYTECNSAFFKCAISLTDFVMILPSVVTATRTCPMNFETDKVQAALKSANVSSWLISFKENQKLQTYRNWFASISSSDAAQQFIEAYKDFDPEALVDQARQKLEPLRLAEAEAARQKAIAKEKQRLDQLAKEEAQAKLVLDSEQKAKEAEELRWKKTRDFRKRLSIGSETFCGPVIAIRSPMIQITLIAPLPGYSSEPWLKLDEVFPAEVASCKNTNGRLVPLWFQ